jgi:chemotaxis protein methyltransferase CheR
LLADVSAFVAARYGLHFPPHRFADLERGIAAVARDIDLPDVATCARRIVSASLGSSHAEILAAHLTTGETYFFRGKGTLAILEQRIFPELIRERSEGERRLRIWSAGCSTGEEPYSVAMLLDQLIPDQRAWDITILATDVNAASLAKAATAVYGEWSFRDTPAWIRPRYFSRGEDGRFELQPRIRSRVTFAKLNLAETSYPSPATNTHAMDVILCRNVLIYLTSEHVHRVVDNLHQALVDGGWLLVSPSEASHRWFPQFVSVSSPDAIVYRRKGGNAGMKREIAAVMAGNSASTSSLPPHPAAGGREGQQVHALPESALSSAALSALARAQANQGSLAEALTSCERWLAIDNLNPACH